MIRCKQMINTKRLLHFDWDKGNEKKNWSKHRVTRGEAEAAFFDPNKQDYPDPTHSMQEKRHIIIGQTKNGRLLFLVYTTRDQTIRVISPRNVKKPKEVKLYEKTA